MPLFTTIDMLKCVMESCNHEVVCLASMILCAMMFIMPIVITTISIALSIGSYF